MRIRQQHLVGAVSLNELNGCARLKPTPRSIRERERTNTLIVISSYSRFVGSRFVPHFSFSHRNAFERSYDYIVYRCDHNTLTRQLGFGIRYRITSFVWRRVTHTWRTHSHYKFCILTCIHTSAHFIFIQYRVLSYTMALYLSLSLPLWLHNASCCRYFSSQWQCDLITLFRSTQ